MLAGLSAASMFSDVYTNPVAKGEESKVEGILDGIYEHYVLAPEELPPEYRAVADAEGVERAVCDYVSGMDTLTPREKKVLELRFGILDGRTRTLEEVGKEFNVTRERIRQIEAKALRKLRHPSRSKRLRDFLN